MKKKDEKGEEKQGETVKEKEDRRKKKLQNRDELGQKRAQKQSKNDMLPEGKNIIFGKGGGVG